MHVGVWHHIALGCGTQDETQAWRDYADTGPTPWTRVFDHYFFDSCYSMSPGGRVEMCTSGPGFTLDEKLEDLGNRLSLSPRTEPLREKLERELVQIVNPRPRGKAKAARSRPRRRPWCPRAATRRSRPTAPRPASRPRPPRPS